MKTPRLRLTGLTTTPFARTIPMIALMLCLTAA